MSVNLSSPSLKRLCLTLAALAGLSACDMEMPNLVNLGGGGGSRTATALRLPPQMISRSDSVRMARTQASRFGVDTALVLGVITQESGFNANALSPVGAMGLMQLMPGTVQMINNASPFSIASAYNPNQNVAGGTWYLRSLYNQFRGYPEERRWQFALASYNGGYGRVNAALNKASQALKKPRTQLGWNDISGYLPAETRGYVPAVMSHRAYYRRYLGSKV